MFDYPRDGVNQRIGKEVNGVLIHGFLSGSINRFSQKDYNLYTCQLTE